VAADRPWKTSKDGLVVRVRVTPKSSRDKIEGVKSTAEGPALKARVRAVPEDGAANEAVAALLADWMGVAKRSVTLVAGGKSRVKSLAVAGDPAQLDAALSARLTEFGTGRGN